ncbi:MAG TPA: PrgI family protein [Candidatus Parcubacteria bacterium]|nr:PrgI family protein [Candidatus Parcubacteria bacterium]
MQFTIPQFIEKEPKIVGPFTFKQFIFIGVSGGLCILLYFVVPLSVFIIISVPLVGIGLSLALLKVEGVPLPTVIKNFFSFIFGSKLYLWKKKNFAPIAFKKEKTAAPEKIQNQPELKTIQGSQLNKLFINLETKK